MDWFAWDFNHPAYFTIYADKVQEAQEEGPGLTALLDLPAGSRVLDLPCGWGRLQPYLRAAGLEVIGGDLSPLNLARHQAEQPAPLVRLDFRNLPFQEGCADGVFCAYTSWGYFATEAENLRQLQEFARVLRPGGVLLLDLVGRRHVQEATADALDLWLDFPAEGYQERVTWSPDGRRVITERVCQGTRFCHDIWIPTEAEVRGALEASGLELDRAYGGLDGRPWAAAEERRIYRAIKR